MFCLPPSEPQSTAKSRPEAAPAAHLKDIGVLLLLPPPPHAAPPLPGTQGGPYPPLATPLIQGG